MLAYTVSLAGTHQKQGLEAAMCPWSRTSRSFPGLQVVVAQPHTQTKNVFSPSSYLAHDPLALSSATGLSCTGRP